jgi:formylglycine-generating enzyme required for sulfatase activity
MSTLLPLAASAVDRTSSRAVPAPPKPDMIGIAGGTFLMGSDKHYPEERPAHRVSVDGFWIDRTPVTNERFRKFVEATGHVTFAEIPPNPDDYPGALPHMLYAGSLVFVKPPAPVDLRDMRQWWQFVRGADWQHPFGPQSSIEGRERQRVGRGGRDALPRRIQRRREGRFDRGRRPRHRQGDGGDGNHRQSGGAGAAHHATDAGRVPAARPVISRMLRW